MNTILKRTIFIGLFLIPFVPFLVSSAFFFPYIVTKVFAWRIIIEVVLAAWVVLALRDPEYRLKKSPLLYGVLAFLLSIGLSDMLGIAPLKSFWSNFERMEGYISLLHLGAFFVVISSVFKERDWTRWWNTSLVASGMMVGYSILQLLGVLTIQQGGVRVDGTFGNAIYLAVYMLIHFFVTLLLLVREKSQSQRWVYGGLMFFQAMIIYFTATRGTILALLGGLLVFALLNIANKEEKQIRKTSLGVLAALILVVGGFFLMKNTEFVRTNPVLGRFATLSVSELQGQGRYFVWPMAWEGFKKKPILGWGQENFSYVFQEHYSADMYALEPWFDRAHNIFLDWMVAGGVLGLAFYLSLYGISLYLIWKKGGKFSFLEKTVLTSLIAAYFFHNIFVFDHLVSYVLFFSFLSYLHYRYEGENVWTGNLTESQAKNMALPATALVFLVVLYFGAFRPISANSSLLSALQALQAQGGVPMAMERFESAYEKSRLGRQEVIEQFSGNVVPLFSASNVSVEVKNNFFAFTKQAIEEGDKEFGDDARYKLLTGAYFSSVGNLDEALKRLDAARALMPAKQVIYFEIGAAYINAKKPAEALAAFKNAYELAPKYLEANLIYLIGAIYAKDSALEAKLLLQIDERTVAFDDRIANAYYAEGRIDRVKALINARKSFDPANTSLYDDYLRQLEN